MCTAVFMAFTRSLGTLVHFLGKQLFVCSFLLKFQWGSAVTGGNFFPLSCPGDPLGSDKSSTLVKLAPIHNNVSLHTIIGCDVKV